MTLRDGAAERAPSRELPLIAGLALAVMVPELATGPGYTDSFRYNHVWTELFTRAFAAGDPYPRWLDGSWYGLGSPTFYFYPPFFFWIAALVRLLSGGALSAGAAASLASALVLAGSGAAMRAWLAVHVDRRRALAGAIAYMLAPYHLYDIYCRGALAEACAYPMLPLIALGLARGRVTLIAAGVAGLLLAHLPVALLAGVTMIPVYTLYLAARSEAPARSLALAAAGGAIGAGIAALYWLPALRLIPFISADALGGAFYRPETWFFWRPGDWPGVFRMLIVVALSLGALLLALAGSRKGEGRVWAAIAVLGVAMLSGAIPWVWRLPGLAQVQFPWRLLVVVEFAGVSAFVIGGGRLASPPGRGAMALLAVGAAMALMVAIRMGEAGWRGGVASRALLARGWEEAPEYLPAGFPIPLDADKRADPGNIRLPQAPPASAADPRARVAMAGDRVTIDTPAPTRIVLRRFYFPRWRVTPDAAIEPYGPGRLLSWRAPAGRHAYRLAPASAPGERAGAWISLAALLAWLAALGVDRRRRVGSKPAP